MKYHVQVNGDTLEIDLIERGGALIAVTEDGEWQVELEPIRGGAAFSLFVGEQSLPVVASGPNDQLALTLGAETWHCSVHDDREAIAAAAAGGDGGGAGAGLVRSAMPGIVREVRVTDGESVERGQALLILEAMKMQNEIRADADGTVAKVHVEAGIAVAKGDPLITLE